MNYYIIPKSNFNIKIKVQLTDEKTEPFLSYSLIYYLNNINNQISNLEESNNEQMLDYINKIVNPFEFIHTNVPGSIISVSKVKPESCIFFELMEILQIGNIDEILLSKQKMNIAHITANSNSTTYLFDILRENNEDNVLIENFIYNDLYDKFINNTCEKKMDLFIFELKEDDYSDIKNYIKNMLLILNIILKQQSDNGISIIKIDNIFYKPIIDIIYIFSSIFEKIYLVKPLISKVTKSERYIVCKFFNANIVRQTKLLEQTEENISKKLIDGSFDIKYIKSVIQNEISYYFLNKIEESNAVIGQQQLESYDQIINIFKNKNRDEKIENLKRNHIQKCIQWCERNQLPHNKFLDKINIFLNYKKKEIDEVITKPSEL